MASHLSRSRPLLLLVVIAGLAAASPIALFAADEKNKPNVFTDAAEAGTDFTLQGEYDGTAENGSKLGAQVVALGDGKFDVYFLNGGLPGAGWDGKNRNKVSGKASDGKMTIESKEIRATITDGTLSGKYVDNTFKLTHVVRKSSTLGEKPPEGAIVLFDGTSADHWNGGKIVEQDLLFRGVTSKKGFGAGKLHLEFRCPFQPKDRGQGRGNSGVYIQGKEVQILDSFGLTGENNECGGWYGYRKPDVNMCFPPLSWQTFDIEISYDGKQTLGTVYHNGVKVHEGFVIHSGEAKPASINLQNHGNPVMFRNIWWAPK